jgi:DNA-directed RNA polymerase subunit RPC12/RpoP
MPKQKEVACPYCKERTSHVVRWWLPIVVFQDEDDVGLYFCASCRTILQFNSIMLRRIDATLQHILEKLKPPE